MNTGDVPDLKTDMTSGLGSANQLITLTSVQVVSSGMNTTASPRRLMGVRVAVGVQNRPSMKQPPRLMAEAKWKRLATAERKKVRARGFRPSDVDLAVTASRYRR